MDEACKAHPDAKATGRCAVCEAPGCDACLACAIDGRPACEACAAREDDRSEAIGSAVLLFVGVGYLATLAVGYLLFRARPFVGGLAAVVSIALGRAIQMYVRPRVVTRRPSAARAG